MKFTEINQTEYTDYCFDAIASGELFYCPEQNCIYLKIEPIKSQYSSKQLLINAICLNDGTITHFKATDIIYYVSDAELRYELEKS